MLHSLEDRFHYLRLGRGVGDPTFDDMRWVNQQFYTSTEWRKVRQHVIARDLGMDLGASEWPVQERFPIVHHMNPLTIDDILDGSDNLLDPEFLITTGLRTHNAIHYGDERLLPRPFVERRPDDTLEWERLF